MQLASELINRIKETGWNLEAFTRQARMVSPARRCGCGVLAAWDRFKCLSLFLFQAPTRKAKKGLSKTALEVDIGANDAAGKKPGKAAFAK